MLTADDFDQLFRRHHERLLKTALDRLGGNPHDAADAAAETWAQAFEQRHTWDPERGVPPLGWLLTLLRYACLAIVRNRTGHPTSDLTGNDKPDWVALDTDDTGPHPGLTDPLTHQRWAQVWPVMAEREATAVWLRCIGGYTTQEAADILDVNPHTIISLTAAGLRKIEQFFRDGHRATSTSCKRCGYRPLSLGHRTLCQREQRERNINSQSRWPSNGGQWTGTNKNGTNRNGTEGGEVT